MTLALSFPPPSPLLVPAVGSGCSICSFRPGRGASYSGRPAGTTGTAVEPKVSDFLTISCTFCAATALPVHVKASRHKVIRSRRSPRLLESKLHNNPISNKVVLHRRTSVMVALCSFRVCYLRAFSRHW